MAGSEEANDYFNICGRVHDSMAADRYQHNSFVFKTITALRIVIGVAVTLAVLFVMVWLIDYSSIRTTPASRKPIVSFPDNSEDTIEANRQDQTFFESLLRKRAREKENNPGNELNIPSRAPSADGIDSKKNTHSPAVLPAAAQSGDRRVRVSPESQAAKSAAVYAVQLGSFQQVERAQAFSEKLAAKGYQPYIMNIGMPDGTMTYRVRVGRFTTREQAKTMAARMERAEKISVFVTSQ